MRWHRKLLGIGLSLTLLSAPITTEALLVSTIISGRAGATVALPTDTFVAAYNPAGMSFIGNRWDLGVNWQRDWGRTKISGNANIESNETYNDHQTENFFIPEFGVNKQICDCTMTIGLIVYNRRFSKVDFDTNIPIFGDKDLGCEYLQETLSPVWSIHFGCGDHALGISIDFVGQRLKVNGLERFANHVFSTHPHRVTNRGYQYSGGIGATVGWMSRVSDAVSIGLAWQPQIKMSHISGYKGLVAKHGQFNLPQRFIGGFAVEFLCDAFLAFDIEYVCWHSIPALNHPLLPNLRHLPSFGSRRGVGLRWGDQINFRFGLEWKATDYLSVRAGYSYARTPIKRKDALLNILAPNIVEHYGTIGATWYVDYQNQISFFVAQAINNSVNGQRAIPFVFGGGNVRLKENKTMAGISWGRLF